MSDSIHETAATPSVSLAAVAMCVCVFSKTMYLDSQRYTVFWPYTVCRPNTKNKISRTHTRTDFFFGMYQLETPFARKIFLKSRKKVEKKFFRNDFRNLSQNRKVVKVERDSHSHTKFDIKSMPTLFSIFQECK